MEEALNTVIHVINFAYQTNNIGGGGVINFVMEEALNTEEAYM